MKREVTLYLLLGMLFVGHMEGQGRGNFGGGRSLQGGHHGRAGFGGGRGHYGSNIRPYPIGGSNFRASYRGAFYRHRLYSPGFFSPFYWADDYSEPFIDDQLFQPEFLNGERLYYQRATAPVVETNCQDIWSGNSTRNSVSHTMNRIFEMQCENRHPSPDAELRHPARASSGTSNPTATPTTQN